MAFFPAGFPAPLQAGYQPKRIPQVLESDMESGPVLTRRISTVRRYTIPVELILTATQAATYQDWFDAATGCAGGSAWFTGLLLNLGDGQGVRNTVECRIVSGAYDLVLETPTNWKLSFTVETR